MRFRRILWTKNVALDEGELAYGGVDKSVKAREPKRPGDLFELHSTPEDAESLAEPELGDIIVLTQHRQVTHLAEFEGLDVEPRSRRSMRRGTRDSRFSMQRTCRLIVMRSFEEAPFVDDAFGFDPKNEGGEVWAIDELPAFVRAGKPLWAVQRRIDQKMAALPSARQLFQKRHAEIAAEQSLHREMEAAFLTPRVAARPRLKVSHRGLK